MLVKLEAFTGAEQPPDAFCKKVSLERCFQNSQEKACVYFNKVALQKL